jgi:hypothetical protein
MKKNLYSNGYKSLVSQIYSPYVREFEIEAYLPKFIYTTISLTWLQLVMKTLQLQILP